MAGETQNSGHKRDWRENPFFVDLTGKKELIIPSGDNIVSLDDFRTQKNGGIPSENSNKISTPEARNKAECLIVRGLVATILRSENIAKRDEKIDSLAVATGINRDLIAGLFENPITEEELKKGVMALYDSKPAPTDVASDTLPGIH